MPNAYLHIDCTLISWGKTYGHAEAKKKLLGEKHLSIFLGKIQSSSLGLKLGWKSRITRVTCTPSNSVQSHLTFFFFFLLIIIWGSHVAWPNVQKMQAGDLPLIPVATAHSLLVLDSWLSVARPFRFRFWWSVMNPALATWILIFTVNSRCWHRWDKISLQAFLNLHQF